MAETRLGAGLRSLDAAGWEDATGFANDAELAIVDSFATHENLDRSADTTTGVDYFHIRGGAPRFGPENGRLLVEFDATYTAKSNFVWKTRGGLCYLEYANTTCGASEFIGAGNCFAQAGVNNNLIMGGRNTLKALAACDIAAVAATIAGQAYLEVEAAGGFTIPILRMPSGNPHVYTKRRVEAATQLTGLLRVDNRTGSPMTTLDLFGGTFRLIAGDVDTVNWYGGTLETAFAEEGLTFGGTAFNVYHGNPVPDSTDLVIMSTHIRVPGAIGFGGAAQI